MNCLPVTLLFRRFNGLFWIQRFWICQKMSRVFTHPITPIHYYHCLIVIIAHGEVPTPATGSQVNHICVNERICYVHAAKCSAGMASCLASVSSKIWQVFGEEFLGEE